MERFFYYWYQRVSQFFWAGLTPSRLGGARQVPFGASDGARFQVLCISFFLFLFLWKDFNGTRAICRQLKIKESNFECDIVMETLVLILKSILICFAYSNLIQCVAIEWRLSIRCKDDLLKMVENNLFVY